MEIGALRRQEVWIHEPKSVQVSTRVTSANVVECERKTDRVLKSSQIRMNVINV